jgi:hypothetical protein
MMYETMKMKRELLSEATEFAATSTITPSGVRAGRERKGIGTAS